MPSIWEGRDLQSILVRHERILRGMATQQQTVWSNAEGIPVAVTGRIPGSNPSSYGLQFLDPTSHVPTAFFGEDGTLGTGLYFYNASGSVASKIDHTGYHFYDASGNEVIRVDAEGIHAYNPNYAVGSNEEARFGQLSTSPAIYGAGVAPATGSAPGTLQQVGGFLSVQGLSASGVTATTWTNFPGSSSLTAEVGPSESAQVAVQAYLATGTAGEQAFVGVAVDGVNKGAWADIASGAGGVSTTTGSSFTLTGLTAGSHTFQVQYKTLTGTSCTFGAAMSVQPL